MEEDDKSQVGNSVLGTSRRFLPLIANTPPSFIRARRDHARQGSSENCRTCLERSSSPLPPRPTNATNATNARDASTSRRLQGMQNVPLSLRINQPRRQETPFMLLPTHPSSLATMIAERVNSAPFVSSISPQSPPRGIYPPTSEGNFRGKFILVMPRS